MNKKLSLLLLLALIPFNVFAVTGKLATLYIPGTNIKKVVVAGTPGIFTGGYKLWTGDKKLGYSVVTDFGPRLSVSMTSVQATVPVTSMSIKDGHTLVMSDFGSVVYLTIEPGAVKEEIVACTGISGLTFTGCTRGLAFHGTSTASVAANAKSHQSGSSVILSNVHYVYNKFVNVDDSQTIDGVKTFTSRPTSTTSPASSLDQIATIKDIMTATTTGGVNATPTIKGISQIATGIQAASSTAVGSTGANLVIPTSITTSTAGSNYVIPVTGNTGRIAPGFYQGNDNTWSGSNIFSATSTFSGASTTFSNLVSFNGSTTINTINNIGGGFTHIQVITSATSTWTRPAGVTKIKVRVVGGGGASGAVNTGSSGGSGGGGGGGYSEKIIDVSATSSINVVVGFGGPSILSNSAGGTGSTTSFGNFLSASGGLGGAFSTGVIANGGNGGIGSNGDININGSGGGGFMQISGPSAIGGLGGSSVLGGGAAAQTSATSFNGLTGGNYGGGGSGCFSTAASGCTSGAGANGVVIVEY